MSLLTCNELILLLLWLIACSSWSGRVYQAGTEDGHQMARNMLWAHGRNAQCPQGLSKSSQWVAFFCVTTNAQSRVMAWKSFPENESRDSFCLSFCVPLWWLAALLHTVVLDVQFSIVFARASSASLCFRRKNRREVDNSVCICKQTQLTWMRMETAPTLMNFPIKDSTRSPEGRASLQCLREATGEGVHWAVETLFHTICDSSQASWRWQHSQCVFLWYMGKCWDFVLGLIDVCIATSSKCFGIGNALTSTV